MNGMWRKYAAPALCTTDPCRYLAFSVGRAGRKSLADLLITTSGCHNQLNSRPQMVTEAVRQCCVPCHCNDNVYLTQATIGSISKAKTIMKSKIQHSLWFCGILLGVLFSGCAGLPEYALPRTGAITEDPAKFSEALTYRPLTRSDFKASALPADKAAHSDFIQAHTCARIQPTKSSKFSISRARFNGAWSFFGSIQTIGFEAVMFPGCSWWNPKMPANMHRYVLQHEQIHFAIAELTARRLTADARLKAQSFLSIQPTRQAVREEITARVHKWMQSAMTDSLAQQTEFDEDTSMYPSPRWQQWWQEKIEKQLAEMPPQTMDKGQGDPP
jgi:hypothetical protein